MRSLTIFVNVRNSLAAGTIALGLSLGTSSANASDCHQPQYYYKTVVVYESVQKPCVTWIKKYDHCDRPYLVKVVTYKTVEVAVEKRIRVAL